MKLRKMFHAEYGANRESPLKTKLLQTAEVGVLISRQLTRLSGARWETPIDEAVKD